MAPELGPIVTDPLALAPQHRTIQGRTITLEPLSTKHTNSLFECLGGNEPRNASA